MYLLKRSLPAFLTLFLMASAAFCHDAEPPKFYKLDFVVKEVEGTKVINSRSYYTIVSEGSGGDKSSIRAQSKMSWVPKPPNTNGQPFATTQYQQINAGVSIDVSAVNEVQNRLSLHLLVEVAAFAEDKAESTQPVIRQHSWSSTLVIPLKKPTVVFSSDMADAKGQMQVEVTATPLP